MISEIRMSVISDIHLGHNKTPTSWIIDNLNKYFLGSDKVKSSNLIIIAGDFWDRLKNMRDSDSTLILTWIAKLIRFCNDRKIILRILNGTPSHDYAQSIHFLNTMQSLGIDINIRYVDEVFVEHIAELDCTFLYVPDEWRVEHDQTWIDVQACLAEHGLKKVDFAIMHGMFDLQVGRGLSIPSHSSAKYRSIVNKLIFIGHDHTHQVHGNIVVQGSFDRLSHGYESPKGFIYASITNTAWKITFIENRGAMRYDTIDCRNRTMQNIMEIAHQLSVDLTAGSHVRLLLSDNYKDIKTASLSSLYPNIKWSISLEKKTKQTASEVKTQIVTAVGITPAELMACAEKRLSSRCSDPQLMQRALSILREGIEHVTLRNTKQSIN